jgi:enamine deaminase RidA (YjgF/YER057c/UK114 family)
MTLNRINISSGAPWEAKASYSRAVKIGNHIFVSGTTATDLNGEITGAGNYYLQSSKCIENIKSALEKAGASLSDVVRIRIFVTDISKWELVAEALNEYFSDIKPAATMVEVNRLISPEILVEIEADAFIA